MQWRLPHVLKRFLGFAALLVFIVLCSPLFVERIDQNGPLAINGVVDFSQHGNFDEPVKLSGQWTFRWAATGLAPEDNPQTQLTVPGEWEGQQGPNGIIYRDKGFGNYGLTVQGLRPGQYLLYIPVLYGATQVSIDGRVVSTAGQIGSGLQSTQYRVRSHTVPIEASQKPVRIRIDIATSHHRDNGMESSPVLGPSAVMTAWGNLSLAQDLFLPATLVLIFVFSAVVFVLRDKDRPSFFLGASFISMVPIVLIAAHENLLGAALPNLSFTGLVSIQYVCGIFALGFFAAYAESLFYRDRIRFAMVGITAILGAQLVFVVWLLVTGDTYTASGVSQMMYPVRLAIFLYIIVLAIRAAMQRREASLLFLVGLTVLLISLGLRAMVTNGYITADQALSYDFTTEGVLIFLLMQMVIMAERWSLAIKREEHVSDELRSLLDVNRSIAGEIHLEKLLEKIVTLSSKVVRAERSSLFLHDQLTDELWSVIAEGVGDKRIRFASDIGLAGYCFTSGESLKIANAYEDPRFNRSIDADTGFVTGSVLALPVTTRDGRRLGVMQALNSHDGTFDSDDQDRMQAFVAQAAVAIDNASLFAEVNAARNYNDSILTSMSSGVITLDRTRQLTKLNKAACAILDVQPDEAEAMGATELLLVRNPWLNDELEGVAGLGGPISLQDRDFETPTGTTISVNLSIVPLRLDGEQVGILIIIEDITEGKRLQGAMRRFMTQEIFDQVTQQGDLLFGSACQASVLFADIRGFTTIAEKQNPRETVDMLNDVFSELVDAVLSSGGVLDKFIGDAVMAVYGAPIASEHDRQNAVESALQMLFLMNQLNQRRIASGAAKLRLGIGIASGAVVSGTIGSPKRMDYTVIGDSVNLAARLQDLTKFYGADIVVCENTATDVPAGVLLRELDCIRVRGRDHPETIFEVLDDTSLSVDRTNCIRFYEKGRHLLRARDWQAAINTFNQALSADGEDVASKIMLQRATAFKSAPPPKSWDGAWPYVAKS